MKNKLLIIAILCILTLSLDAQTPNKDQKIEIALSAAPASVAEGETVMEWDSRKILHQETANHVISTRGSAHCGSLSGSKRLKGAPDESKSRWPLGNVQGYSLHSFDDPRTIANQ
jgi:hypothetical protein